MSIRVVVFDCDGVLFDSEPANVAFYREVIRRSGVPDVAPSEEAAYHALASTQLFEKLYGDRPDLLAHVQRVARDTDYGPFFPLMAPKPLLRETLATLRVRYATAMATNRGQTTQKVLDIFALRDLFDLAVGVLDVARPKPHPDMLLRCLDHFGAAPQEAVYVGDQPTDAEAALSAGMHFIGMGPMAPLSAMAAHAFEDIPRLVASLEGPASLRQGRTA